MSTSARTAVPEITTPAATKASSSLDKYLPEFFSGAFGAMFFKFYETGIGLPAFIRYLGDYMLPRGGGDTNPIFAGLQVGLRKKGF